MSPRLLAATFAILLTGAVRAAESGATPAENPMTARFRDTRSNIELLFDRRADSAQRPDPRFNPFRTTTYLASTAVFNEPGQSVAGTAVSITTDNGILRFAADLLDIGGTLTKEGVVRASTSQGNYAVGDRIRVPINGTIYWIQVRRADVNGVLIGLNTAELLVPFYPSINRAP